MERKSYTLYREGFGIGPMTTVADCSSGVIYHCWGLPQRPGAIIGLRFNVEPGSCRADVSPQKGQLNMKVLRAVHPNTVRAMARRLEETNGIDRGYWYEVHAD